MTDERMNRREFITWPFRKKQKETPAISTNSSSQPGENKIDVQRYVEKHKRKQGRLKRRRQYRQRRKDVKQMQKYVKPGDLSEFEDF